MTAASEAPCCECGRCHGPDNRLPEAAWSVAGAGGIGKGVEGTDLLACAPGHVPACCVVLEDHGTWAVCGASA